MEGHCSAISYWTILYRKNVLALLISLLELSAVKVEAVSLHKFGCEINQFKRLYLHRNQCMCSLKKVLRQFVIGETLYLEVPI